MVYNILLNSSLIVPLPQRAGFRFPRSSGLCPPAGFHASREVAAANSPENAPLKVSMVSLGCPKNTVDGEVLLGDLFRSGFEVTDVHEDADAIVINTCAFVEDAKAESVETIIEASRLKDEGKARKVIVTGCLAQRYSEELAAQLPEADLVVGFEKYGGLATAVRDVLGRPPDIDLDDYQRRSRVQVGNKRLFIVVDALD